MKKYLFSVLALVVAFPVLAHADTDVPCGWQGMMGGSMMGSAIGTPLFFIAPLISLAFWVLVLALLAGLVRWVWKKGDGKK